MEIKTDYKNFKDPEFKFPAPNSKFLNTAYRVPMDMPMGTLTYMDMSFTPPSKPDEMGEASMSVMTKFVQAEMFKVDSVYSQQQIKDLSEYGISGIEHIVSTAYEEMCKGYEIRLMKMYQESGRISKESTPVSKWKRLMFRLGFEDIDYAENPITKILMYSNLIAACSRRGPANFVIVTSRSALYFISMMKS
jgi:hypothetical protein